MTAADATDVSHSRISRTFQALCAKRQIALMPFVPAGFPDLDTTAEVLPAIERAGASAIEIGFPFSDPIADGPTIQEAFADALARGVRVADVFELVRQVRPSVSIPLVGMVSYSIVFRFGVWRFLQEAKVAGFDGLIVPDLPPPEAKSICEQVRRSDLDTVLLVAPTTTPQRRSEIASLCSGFVYYLSISGITGEREQLPPDIAANVRAIKQLADRPVCVGFGISRPQHVASLAGVADGAIVGSALVRRMRQNCGSDAPVIATAVGDYCRELLSMVR